MWSGKSTTNALLPFSSARASLSRPFFLARSSFNSQGGLLYIRLWFAPLFQLFPNQFRCLASYSTS